MKTEILSLVPAPPGWWMVYGQPAKGEQPEVIEHVSAVCAFALLPDDGEIVPVPGEFKAGDYIDYTCSKTTANFLRCVYQPHRPLTDE